MISKLEERSTLLENNEYPLIIKEKMRESCFQEIMKLEMFERREYLNRYWLVK